MLKDLSALGDTDELVLEAVMAKCVRKNQKSEIDLEKLLSVFEVLDEFGEQVSVSAAVYLKQCWPQLWVQQESENCTGIYAATTFATPGQPCFFTPPAHVSKTPQTNVPPLQQFDQPPSNMFPGERLILNEGWSLSSTPKDVLKAAQCYVADERSRKRSWLIGCEPRNGNSGQGTSSYWRRLSDHEKLESILSTERTRGLYPATVSSSKVVLAGSFRFASLSHFLPFSDAQKRSSLRVSSTSSTGKWNGALEASGREIKCMADLESALRTVTLVGEYWYRPVVASIFQSALRHVQLEMLHRSSEFEAHRLHDFYLEVFDSCIERLFTGGVASCITSDLLLTSSEGYQRIVARPVQQIVLTASLQSLEASQSLSNPRTAQGEVICRQFQRSSSCSYGDSCKFKHVNAKKRVHTESEHSHKTKQPAAESNTK